MILVAADLLRPRGVATGPGKQVARWEWSGRDSSFERTIRLPALPVSGSLRYLISIFEDGRGGRFLQEI